MTVAAAWIRKVNNCEELIFISDSRLCGGLRWDECPKIFPLNRSDCAICFAGSTAYSYPMIMQTFFAINEMGRIRDRAMDIRDLNGVVLKHINHLSSSIYDSADNNDIAQNQFLFGGYSWIDKEFEIWRYTYNKADRKFQKDGKRRNFERRFGNIKFIGDQEKGLKAELRKILCEKYGEDFESYENNGLDMEPFEALRNLLRGANKQDTIGGAPQVIKVYQHMNTRPTGVYWPQKTKNVSSNRTLMGRKMFEFENTDYWFLDPDSLITSPSTNSNRDMKEQEE